MFYRTVRKPTEYELEREIDRLTQFGWRPQGGVSVATPEPLREIWAQAMVKTELRERC